MPTATNYEICVDGHLDAELEEWFTGLKLSHEPDGTTRLIVPLRDQAELHGLLVRLRDLNLTLLSLSRTDAAAT